MDRVVDREVHVGRRFHKKPAIWSPPRTSSRSVSTMTRIVIIQNDASSSHQDEVLDEGEAELVEDVIELVEVVEVAEVVET